MEALRPQGVPVPSDQRVIAAVQSITRTLSSTLDPAEGLRRTLQVAAECVDAAGGSIWQHDPVARQLVCRHVCGEKASELVGFRIRDTEGIAGQVFQNCAARIDPDPPANPRYARRVDEQIHHETYSMVSIPVCYPGGVAVGVMQLVNKRAGDFTAEDLTVLEIVAHVCAMSLLNADLAQQALRSHALGYVAGFAHDIYNRIASFVTGVPTLRMILDELFAGKDDGAAGAPADLLREDAFALLAFMEQDADLVYRYARFIASLARDLPLETRFEEADLVATAEAQVLQLQRRARELRVALRVEAAGPVLCAHDRLLIGSAVYNLVNNALPETPDGTVQVGVRAEGRSAVVEVRDTGRGMPAGLLHRILQGNATSTKPGGSGIGTMIVKKVAEIHCGTLEGESAEGVGTTFRLRLPLRPPAIEHRPEADRGLMVSR